MKLDIHRRPLSDFKKLDDVRKYSHQPILCIEPRSSSTTPENQIMSDPLNGKSLALKRFAKFWSKFRFMIRNIKCHSIHITPIREHL